MTPPLSHASHVPGPTSKRHPSAAIHFLCFFSSLCSPSRAARRPLPRPLPLTQPTTGKNGQRCRQEALLVRVLRAVEARPPSHQGWGGGPASAPWRSGRGPALLDRGLPPVLLPLAAAHRRPFRRAIPLNLNPQVVRAGPRRAAPRDLRPPHLRRVPAHPDDRDRRRRVR
jgi:hypothetical protein